MGFWVAGLPGALPGSCEVGRAGAASMVAAAAAMLCTSSRSCLLAFLCALMPRPCRDIAFEDMQARSGQRQET